MITIKQITIILALLAFVKVTSAQCGESAGGHQTVCFNNLPLSLATPPNTHWTGSGISSSGVFDTSVAGVYTVTLVTSSPTCQDSDDKQITVLESPVVSAGTDESVCVNDPFQINATATSTNGNIVVWSWSGNSEYLSATNIPNPIATPLGSASFNLTVADELGCSSFDQVNLTTRNLPVVTAGEDFTMCHNDFPIPLNGTPAGGTWSGPGVSGILFLSPGLGTHNLQYTYTDAFGCENSDQMSVTVIASPDIDAGSDLTVCANEGNIQLTGFIPTTGGDWSGAGIISGSGIVDPSLLDGLYILTYSTGVGTCYVEDTRRLRVNPSPAVNALSDYNFCHGVSNATLDDYSPLGGHWLGSIISNSSSGTVNSNSLGTNNQVRYVYEDLTTSCSDTAFAEVHIREIPVADFTAESIACKNSAIGIQNFSDNSLDFSWLINDAEVSQSIDPAIPIGVEGVHQVKLIVSSQYGCSHESGPQDVEVISIPTAEFTSDVTEGCEPLQVTYDNLSFGAYTTYHWDFEVGNSINDEPGTIDYGDVLDDTIFTTELTASNECGADVYTIDVLSKAIPLADFHTEISTICSPVFTQFFNTSSTNATQFTWDLGNGDTSNQETPNNKIYTTEGPSETILIELTAENECGSDTKMESLEILPNPVTAGIFSSTLEACAPIDIELTSSAIGATSITYDFGDFTIENFNTSHTFMEEGVYEIKQYATDGCGFDTTTIEIVVFPEPIVLMTMSQAAICTGQSIEFDTSGEPLMNYQWDLGSLGASTDPAPNVVFSDTGEEEISLVVYTQENNCLVNLSETIDVRPLPEIQFDLSSDSGCAPFSLDINNSSPSGASFTWSIANFESGSLSPTFDLTDPGVYNLQVTAVNAFGCENQQNFSAAFVLHETPGAEFSFSPFEGHILTNPTIDFESESSGGNILLWDFGDGITSNLNQPSHTFEKAGTHNVSLTVSNENGCIDKVTRKVVIEDEFSVFVPNSFTPNGDGLNDMFRPIIEGDNYSEYTFMVFDRWGDLLFESNDPTKGWIGNKNGGQHFVLNGVYTWEVRILLKNGKGSRDFVGTVNVFR